MLQRKQSLWLLLAALLNSGVLYYSLWQPTFESDSFEAVRTNNYFDLLILGVTIIVLPLLAIFMFHNRKRKIRLVLLCTFTNVVFIADMLVNVHFSKVKDGNYGIGSVLPVAAIILLIIAISGIRKDEKLVRSVDRLR
jgi:peptidoglycan/LPS O-acetylase OafA/YrhL